MLKEVKYFYLLDRSVPETASTIYKSDQKFKTQITQLEIIVGQYNRIVTCLHPVERPLIQNKIDKLNEVLDKGL